MAETIPFFKNKKSVWLIFLAALGGFLYRAGGAWWGNTKFRDCGVSAVSCLVLIVLGGVHGLWQWLSLIPTFGLMWAALTTYRYFFPKPKDYKWYHYAMHGFFVAAATVFYAWASGYWFMFWVRCIICGAGVGAWSHFVSSDNVEEAGRGIVITGTMALLIKGILK
jgi:hypothetical protein